MWVFGIDPDVIPFFQTAQVDADIVDIRVGQKVSRCHRVLIGCDPENGRIEIDKAVMDALETVEKT